ncbi:putative ribonuclease H-like domain-containing protein [Senna tora]|uniref:Putative ribonuclease H-like domain-containing protein n=1 Tax=Senna tora TaxID=362788 RepID=A0A834THJ0_9FABA|nr:putative ribonuclease H-like domain-containing protein [Senna tora]
MRGEVMSLKELGSSYGLYLMKPFLRIEKQLIESIPMMLASGSMTTSIRTRAVTKVACGTPFLVPLAGLFGNNVTCFYRNLGIGDPLQAEMWGILMGVKMGVESGYDKIIFEGDSLLSIKLIKEGCTNSHPLIPITNNIRNLIVGLNNFKLVHNFGEPTV